MATVESPFIETPDAIVHPHTESMSPPPESDTEERKYKCILESIEERGGGIRFEIWKVICHTGQFDNIVDIIHVSAYPNSRNKRGKPLQYDYFMKGMYSNNMRSGCVSKYTFDRESNREIDHPIHEIAEVACKR